MRGNSIVFYYSIFHSLCVYTIDVLIVCVIRVERKLKGYIDSNDQKTKNCQRQTAQLKGKIHFALTDVAHAGDEIVFKQVYLVLFR